MKTTLLIVSILCGMYPLGLIIDMRRRYQRLLNYGDLLDYKMRNSINYTENFPFYKTPGVKFFIIIGFILGLLSFKELLGYNWLIILLINALVYKFLSQTLAFVTLPKIRLLDKNVIQRICFFSVVLSTATFITVKFNLIT